MRTAVDLIQALAWPTTVLVIAFALRSEIKAVARAVQARVVEGDADVSLGPRGIEIGRRVNLLEGKIDTLDQAQAVLRPTPPHDAGGIDETVRDLARRYVEDTAVPDSVQRVRLKDELADRLGSYVVINDVDRGALAASADQGYLVALATAIVADPRRDDATRLLLAAPRVTWKHVRHRFASAVARLAQRGYVPLAERARLDAMLASFLLSDTDESLRRRVEQARAILNEH